MDAPYDIYDYQVLDRNGRRLGPVTGFWVDDQTNAPEFASVKTGWILGKQHVIPIRDAHFDHGSRMLRVPYEERTIRDAPGFGADRDLSPTEEAQIYNHYHLDRARMTGGVARAGRAGAQGIVGREAEIPLREEKIDVGKRQVETGSVRLKKVVRTETQKVPVELTRERIEIERVPPSELRGTYSGRPFEEDEVTLTERREEPVINKRSEVVGGVRATREVDTERRNVNAELRREDVELDRDRE